MDKADSEENALTCLQSGYTDVSSNVPLTFQWQGRTSQLLRQTSAFFSLQTVSSRGRATSFKTGKANENVFFQM